MTQRPWSLTPDERATLSAMLDALLPPDGSFPRPSETRIIDDFILQRVPETGVISNLPYPRIDSDGLRSILKSVAQIGREEGDITVGLERFEGEHPEHFAILWRLAVYGYYSRPETIAAIQRDLAPAYHGAPQPLGYAFAIERWNADDPLQMPRRPRGSYKRTEEVQRVDMPGIVGEGIDS